MKIDISSIVRDHLHTLYDSRNNRASLGDIFVFYITPALIAFCSYLFQLKLEAGTYNISVTFFGIFIALILNIQVAMFSIFQRKWEKPSESRMAANITEILAERRKLLIELNANLSYLIIVCCFALMLSLLFFVIEFENFFVPAVMVFLYTHFLLTLLMIVKRAHALFHKEYRDSPN